MEARTCLRHEREVRCVLRVVGREVIVLGQRITDNLEQSEVSLFDIDQLIGPGEVVRKPLLPSFRYHPAVGQISSSDLTLPWDNEPVAGDINNVIVGEWARELGAKVEGRQVSSAKSWLSHQAVDRSSDILPWAGAQDVDKVSPVIV